MRHLKPQFKDMQVCPKCGAPAEILGEPWTRHDGTRDWFAAPVEIRCGSRAIGAQERTKTSSEGGRRSKDSVYHVRVYTHLCIRNSFEDGAGKVSDAEEHRYICGVLQQGMTRRVMVDALPDLCFEDEDEQHVPVDTRQLEARWSA